MNDAYDDISFLPTELDQVRLREIAIDGRVEAENGSWVVLRYPPKLNDPLFKEFVLVMNPQYVPTGDVMDLANIGIVIGYLTALEKRRKKK